MATVLAYGTSVLSAVTSAAASAVPWLADVLVLLGLLVMTIGVYGIVRMPDTYTRLHAAGKMVFLGMMPLLVASAVAGDPKVIPRVMLIAFFLLVTTPVSAHVIGQAAYFKGERMRAREFVDESGRNTGYETNH